MDDCLTAPQVEAVKMGYAPARRKTGELIYPGLVPGGEMGWAMRQALGRNLEWIDGACSVRGPRPGVGLHVRRIAIP